MLTFAKVTQIDSTWELFAIVSVEKAGKTLCVADCSGVVVLHYSSARGANSSFCYHAVADFSELLAGM